MRNYRFDRLEIAGSLGDLGTLLPLAIGMILINGLNAAGLFFTVGVFYILSGIYFGVTVPVQPMKVIGAYAIATGLSAQQIQASGLLIGAFLLLIGVTGAITLIGKYVPKPVVRGVQLSTGTLLMAEGVRFIIGTSRFQVLKNAAEPYLYLQAFGPIPIGIIIGFAGGLVTLLFLNNRKFPAGLLLIIGGTLIGVLLGKTGILKQVSLSVGFPKVLPFGFPTSADFSYALLILVLPQVPMTIGNAVIANVDLSREYFGEHSKKVTYGASCISMSLANFLSFLLGGMPLCHGAGGLAAHYRFGARTPGSNIIIGSFFVALAILFGKHALGIVYLIPMSVLGILLLFAGSQLGLTILDVEDRKDLFVVLMILGITLATNLAAGFIAGILVAYMLRSEKLSV